MKVVGIVGYSGSGKTTLIERLIPLLGQAGKRVSVIKHAHHRFDIDRPGKDSFRHREAGSSEVLLVSDQRWALLHELRGESPPSFEEQLALLSPCDIVLVEGYKHAPISKIEVHRAETGHPLLYPADAHVVAVATDEPLVTRLPQLPLDDASAIARFILVHVPLPASGRRSAGAAP